MMSKWLLALWSVVVGWPVEYVRRFGRWPGLRAVMDWKIDQVRGGLEAYGRRGQGGQDE